MIERLLIFSVFIVASCGLGYELIAGALASYLLGDSILQFSSIIGCYLFAMGVGSHCSKYVKEEKTIATFIDIELLVGLIGGLSATLLYLTFAWASAPFRSVLYTLVFFSGFLVGMEIPLVMRVLNQRKAEFSELVSRVLTFDYLGALVVSLLFPLVLAPKLGLARTGLLFGIINVLVAILTVKLFSKELKLGKFFIFRAALTLLLLSGFFIHAPGLITWSEKQIYGDEVVFSSSTQYQRLVVTRWKDDLRLYINGNLQISSRDEYRYHEALVHPALSSLSLAKKVLILGGGDGLAAREVLKYKQIEHISLVDLDPAMTKMFRQNEQLVALNMRSLNDKKVTVFNQDAAIWLQNNRDIFDVIIIDFPDPSNFSLGKLYSVPMYRLVKKHLSENGLVVVQSTSPFHAPLSFWCINKTLQESGFFTFPYHTFVPSFGDWGFIIASPINHYKPPTSYQIPLRYLTAENTKELFYFPPDMPKKDVQSNHLNDQRLVHYFEQDWSQVIR